MTMNSFLYYFFLLLIFTSHFLVLLYSLEALQVFTRYSLDGAEWDPTKHQSWLNCSPPSLTVVMMNNDDDDDLHAIIASALW